MSKTIKILLILLVVTVIIGVLGFGYQLWYDWKYHVSVTFQGRLIVLDQGETAATVDMSGHVRGDVFDVEFALSDSPYNISFTGPYKKQTFEDDWDIPYVWGSVRFLDKHSGEETGRYVSGQYALSVEKGLLLIYADYQGGSKPNVVYYGAVNGDYTLEEIQEYFSLFHTFFGGSTVE